MTGTPARSPSQRQLCPPRIGHGSAKVVESVFAVLNRGGYFMFDLNMEEGFRSRWRGSFGFVEEDHVCVVRSSHDANEKIGRLDVTLFELKGSDWVRTDFPLIQR